MSNTRPAPSTPRPEKAAGSHQVEVHSLWVWLWTGGGRARSLVDNSGHLVDTLLTPKIKLKNARRPPCAPPRRRSTNSLSLSTEPRSRATSTGTRRSGSRPDGSFGNWLQCRGRERTPARSLRREGAGGATRPSEAPPSHTWRGLDSCLADDSNAFCRSDSSATARRAEGHTAVATERPDRLDQPVGRFAQSMPVHPVYRLIAALITNHR
jgi:hypothetical protein